MAQRRLARELQVCMREPSQYFRVWPKDETFMVWEGRIFNLPDTRHAGKQYSLNINFQVDHPFKPPTIRFIDKVKCENILQNGYVCMDILSDQWSPAFTINKLMLCVTSLLTDTPITGLDNKDVMTFLEGIQKKRDAYRLAINLHKEKPRINCPIETTQNIPENVVLNQEPYQMKTRLRRRTELEMLLV